MSEKRPTFVWVFEGNRRVYPPGNDIGRGPIYREHWVQRPITGETSRSFTDTLGCKYPKAAFHDRRDTRRDGYLWTAEEVALDVWAQAHRHKLVDRVRDCSRAELADIAKALCYEPEPPYQDTFGL